MHTAKYWEQSEGGVHCLLCPQSCMIVDGELGLCRVRKNAHGSLKSLVYARPVAVNIDPIEKKPLYHFLPGTSSFSIGTAGCNLACLHCQNADISQNGPDSVPGIDMSPETVVRLAVEKGCRSISYTYNEPTVFHEYAVDCARLARKKGLKNVLVTNGFINAVPADEFLTCMDAANVDLKAFSDGFYRTVCHGRLQPVLDTLLRYHGKLWIEVTNLIIDGKNDDLKDIEQMCRWIAQNLGPDVPLHFSRAFPMHRMQDIAPTPEETLEAALAIARKHLRFVYLGNVVGPSNTTCPKCGSLLISRKYYNIIDESKKGRCSCGEALPGVF
jgi:pyruvate formate lyase activating enzyme